MRSCGCVASRVDDDAVRTPRQGDSMNPLAERYVRLVLAMGQHDADYVDAYYGPPEWRKEAESSKRPLAAIDTRCGGAGHGAGDGGAADRTPTSCVRLRHGYLTRQLDALRARVAMLQGTEADVRRGIEGALRRGRADATSRELRAGARGAVEAKLPGSGPLLERYDAFRSRFVIPRDRLDATFKAAIDECRRRTLAAHHASAGRELHRRVRHEQELERLQLVSGQLPQPDPGEHRPADLRRPRDRPRVPRRLSGPPRLQRAAREESGARSRLGRVLGLPAVLAAVADRRRDGELRHRRGVPAQRAPRVRATRDLSRPPASTRLAPRTTTTFSRSSSACRTPATRRRGGTSTARSTPRARPTGSSDTRSTRRRARSSACASSTSTAAT